mgnify:CR=1 FL=1|tara:strand:- start:688 stop:1491 length:804 start_codon:yes stop_codon:yes gene_type:complete
MQEKIDTKYINDSLQKELSINLITKINKDNDIEIFSNDFEKYEGFTFQTNIALSKISYIFNLQKKSRLLFEEIKKNSFKNLETINFHRELLTKDKKIFYTIDGVNYDKIEKNILNYESFSFTLIEKIEEDLRTIPINDVLTSTLIECFQHLFLFYKISKKNEDKNSGEGQISLQLSKKYERDINNRMLCIVSKGTKCYVCMFDFEDKYGEIGKRFIHVHHINQLSGGISDFDPLRDLIPVCPNCHAMLHKKTPPYSVEELREMTKTK